MQGKKAIDCFTLAYLQIVYNLIDFSHEIDLEAYTKTLDVPREAIERWVAAGILRPDEIKVAEIMLKIMRKNDSGRKKQDPNSTHD